MLKGHPPKYRNGECSRCGGESNRWPDRYCRDCHAEYQREWRAKKKAEIEAMKRRLQELEPGEIADAQQ